MYPRAGHVVLAGTQRCLVKPPRLERRNDRVFLRLRGQDVVRAVISTERGFGGPRRGLRRFLRPSGWSEFQLQPIYNLPRRVAFIGPPFDQATLERVAG